MAQRQVIKPTTLEKEPEAPILSEIQELAKKLIKESYIIWHDPGITSLENDTFKPHMKYFCTIEMFSDWQEASIFIRNTQKPCHVITSGKNGEIFIQSVTDQPHVLSIYVFCENIAYHTDWTKNYPKILCTEEKFDNLISTMKEFILKWQKEELSQGAEFPAFSPFYKPKTSLEETLLKYYLKEDLNSDDRKEAKEDFIELSQAIFVNEAETVTTFEQNYNEYNANEILNLYKGNTFVSKTINKSLKMCTVDSIKYTRFILKDLEHAIREQDLFQNNDYCGVLYQEALLENNEWLQIQENVGIDIELLGFFSAQKIVKSSIDDETKNTLITIIIPGFESIENKPRGLIEDNGVITFNIKSKFKILEANYENNYQNLVLLYNQDRIQEYIQQKNPSYEIPLHEIESLKCSTCTLKSSTLYTSLNSNKTEYLCEACALKSQEKSPLLWLHEKLTTTCDQSQSLKIQGLIINYPTTTSSDLPAFYGYICHECHQTKPNHSFQCIDCNKLYCDKCLNQREECASKGHVLILERSPYSFWKDSPQNLEKSQGLDLFQQGESSFQSKDYSKAITYYEDFLKENNTNQHLQAISYQNLGYSYYYNQTSPPDYQKSLEYYLKTLDIKKTLYTESHLNIARTYLSLAQVYEILKDPQQTIQSYEKAIEIQHKNYGNNHQDLVDSYKKLASVYQTLQKNNQKSLELHEKAIDIQKSLQGKHHISIAEAYYDLANTCNELEENKKALDLHSKALKLKKLNYGEKHQKIVDSYKMIALTLSELNDHIKAVEFINKAIELQKTLTDSPNTPIMAFLYNYQGQIFTKSEEYKEALDAHFKALEIFKIAHTKMHPSTISTYIKLASVHKSLQKYEKSTYFLSRALEDAKSLYGKNHAEIASIYENLAEISQLTGDNPKAMSYLTKVLMIKRSLYGEIHKETALTYNTIASISFITHDYNAALQFYSVGLEIERLTYGNEHEKVAISYSNIGKTYAELNELQKALDSFVKSLEVNRVIYKEENLYIAASYNNIGSVYVSLKQYEQALHFYTLSLEIINRREGEDPINLANLYNNIGSVHTNLGDFTMALQFHAKALEIQTNLHGHDHISTVPSLTYLAAINDSLAELYKAEVLYSKAIEIVKTTKGKNQETMNLTLCLAAVYENQEKYHKAIRWYLKVIELKKLLGGELYPEMADYYEKLGLVYNLSGDYQKATEIFFKAVDLHKAAVAEDPGVNARIANCYNYLGGICYNLSSFPKAIELFSKSLEIRKEIYGERSAEVASLYGNLGALHRKMGQQQKAMEYLLKARMAFQNIDAEVLDQN